MIDCVEDEDENWILPEICQRFQEIRRAQVMRVDSIYRVLAKEFGMEIQDVRSVVENQHK